MNCNALCKCDPGFGGISCAYDGTALASRGALRKQMCEALLNATRLSDPSSQLIESMTTSLYQSYTPFEVVDDATRAICSELLVVLSKSAGKGHMAKELNPDVPALIAKTVSLFAVGSTDGAGSETTSTHQQDAINSVGDLQNGLLKSMVGGQSPTAIISDSVRMATSKTLPSETGGAPLAPPQTEAESTYAAPGPQIILPKGGLICPSASPNSYTQLSIMQVKLDMTSSVIAL